MHFFLMKCQIPLIKQFAHIVNTFLSTGKIRFKYWEIRFKYWEIRFKYWEIRFKYREIQFKYWEIRTSCMIQSIPAYKAGRPAVFAVYR